MIKQIMKEIKDKSLFCDDNYIEIDLFVLKDILKKYFEDNEKNN